MRQREDGLIELPSGRVVQPGELVTFADLLSLSPGVLRTFSGQQMIAGGGGGARGPAGARGATGQTGPQGPPGADALELGGVVGARLTWHSVTAVLIGTAALESEVRNVGNTFTINFTGTIGPVDITASGVNGLDTGVEAPDTWYAVFVIGDSTNVNPPAGLLSVSTDYPTLPAGYDSYRRIGWVRNGAAGDFLAFYQRGAGLDRTYNYNVDRALLLALSGGVATVFTTVPLGAFVPPTSQFVIMNIGFDTQNASDILDIRPTGSTVADPVVFVAEASATSGSRRITNLIEMVIPATSIDYQIVLGGGAGPSADIYIQGFRDSLR